MAMVETPKFPSNLKNEGGKDCVSPPNNTNWEIDIVIALPAERNNFVRIFELCVNVVGIFLSRTDMGPFYPQLGIDLLYRMFDLFLGTICTSPPATFTFTLLVGIHRQRYCVSTRFPVV